MIEPSLGLRESKKRQTRRAISEHATRLFVARGFEATTIAEIAAAARVAKKTVTNYFPRKEDLALDFHEEFIGSLAEVARARPAGTSVLAALRARHREDVFARAAFAGFLDRAVSTMIAESPTLIACLRDLHEQREAALAEALAADRGESSLPARAVAAYFAAAHRVLFQRVQELTLGSTPPDTIAILVTEEARQVFDLLEPSFGDYGA
ncbi:TetR family transcriptional regulator [Catenulispora yoronensis]|uniref:TetR family transcriptional regulator n=1 Tax=Catenulispora yoronensis TaxID=450799 RepID=A0ABP5FIF4_9ACTN